MVDGKSACLGARLGRESRRVPGPFRSGCPVMVSPQFLGTALKFVSRPAAMRRRVLDDGEFWERRSNSVPTLGRDFESSARKASSRARQASGPEVVARCSMTGSYGATRSSSVTAKTPATPLAAISARSLSILVPTAPVRVTLPFLTMMWMVGTARKLYISRPG